MIYPCSDCSCNTRTCKHVTNVPVCGERVSLHLTWLSVVGAVAAVTVGLANSVPGSGFEGHCFVG